MYLFFVCRKEIEKIHMDKPKNKNVLLASPQDFWFAGDRISFKNLYLKASPQIFLITSVQRVHVFQTRSGVFRVVYGCRPEGTYFPKHKMHSKNSSMWNFQIFTPQYLTILETNKKYVMQHS